VSRSILLVSYFFPPARDTGVRRPAAMAKYLARLGHRVTVLTTSAFGTAEHGFEGVEVIRAGDLQRVRARLAGEETVGSLFDSDSYSGRPHPLSYVVVPEPLALAWAPWARRAALGAHRADPFDCVITTSPPESAHAIGFALSRRGVPWVADVRDGWTFEPLRPRFPLALQRRWDRWLERRWLGAADAVVCVSEPAAADLRARRIAEPRVIANAWDPDSDPAPALVKAARGELDPDRVSLLYTGRFGSYGRDPTPLVDAIAELAEESPELAGRLELVVAGPTTGAERELLERGVEPARIRLLGSVKRSRALALQRAADALLLIAQPTRTQLANFKLFEYLAAGRPVLALAAGTEAGRLVAAAGAGTSVRADDRAAIGAALRELVAGRLPPPDPAATGRFLYPAAAEEMAAVLESAISSRKNSSPDASLR
jgi:glycosyltransferase involved in cell wall biosynthesis